MKRTVLISRIVAIVALLFMSSCDELADCVASASPQLQSLNFPRAVVGAAYDQGVTAEIRNDSNDNAYQYYFNIIGSLPPGIETYVNGRTIHFAGIPTTAGRYEFTLSVRVDPPQSYDPDSGFLEDDGRICFGNDTTEKSYSIEVRS
jgi:hypothetical protein